MPSQKVEDEALTTIVELPSRLTIGQLTAAVTEVTGIRCTAAMIYYYERKGLIDVCERTEGGFRLFDLEDVERVAAIKLWQAEGLNLEEIDRELENCNGKFNGFDLTLAVAEDRRTQILKAARQLFPRKGYEATTLTEIAQEAGISSAAIYQYFESKEELFLAVIDLFFFQGLLERLNDSLQGRRLATREDLFRVLVEIGQIIFDAHVQQQDVHRMFLFESRIFPRIARKYRRRLLLPMEELLQQFISAPIEKGVLRNVDPKLAVQAFYGMLLNLHTMQIMLQGKRVLSPPEVGQIAQLVNIYMDGILQQ